MTISIFCGIRLIIFLDLIYRQKTNNMKKRAIIIALLLLALPVSAKDVRDLNIKVKDSLEGVCPSGDKSLGCLYYSIDTVFIRSDLNPSAFRFVLAHELGHWLMHGSDFSLWEGDEELACNEFAIWLWNPSASYSPEKRSFFLKAIGE